MGNKITSNRIRFNLLIALQMLFLTACQENPIDQVNFKTSPSQVEIFSDNLVSTALFERDIAISKNGKEIIYTLGDYKQTKRSLVGITKSDENWSSPKVLSISGKHQDIEPFLSSDGQTLYFASDRPINSDTSRHDYNIWMSKRNEDKWMTPKPLSDVINTISDEFYPSLSDNGNLYFTSQRDYGIGREDIFVSKLVDGVYRNPSVLDSAINTTRYEFNAYINPDEDLLIFSSFGRPDGLGGGDLYYSKKDKDGKWNQAVNMGKEINSKFLDYCPFIDYKRNNFYFTSDRMSAPKDKMETTQEIIEYSNQSLNGFGNIYRVSLDKIFSVPK